MQEKITARGYTSVILAMNMLQFVDKESQPLFTSVRGSDVLGRSLREAWARKLAECKTFELTAAKSGINGKDFMSADETGFMAGVFRQNMLDHYSTPDYQLQKDAVQSDYFSALRRNWQFKKLFEPIWKQWEIYIRPTTSGMFIIRLVRRYDKATPILNISHDVIKLQTSFDLHSAIEEYDKLQRNTYDYSKKDLEHKKKTVDTLLRWLGVDVENPPLIRYAPVQWQLALEVARYFVRELGNELTLPDGKRITLTVPNTSDVPTIHDSHVIYHIDELLTTLTKYAPNREYSVQRTARVVQPEDFIYSRDIRQQVINLLEGAMLKRETPGNPDSQSERHFPIHSDRTVSRTLACDLATWDDELCLLSSRTSVVMPSRRAMSDQLYISTLPSTGNTSLMYPRYWDALERMIEFIVEVRVLAQILERASENILHEFVITLREMREDMLNDYLHIDKHRESLIDLVNAAANLSRLVSVCQSMSNPQVWSRAEYGADKAEHLLAEMKVSVLLEHTERNVNSLTALVNQIDELYLAGLSEDSNRETFWLSVGLASLSLSIILFSLPSFWADVEQLNPVLIDNVVTDDVLPWLNIIGSIAGPAILLVSVGLAIAGLWRAYRVRRQRRGNRDRIQKLSHTRI